MVACVGGGWGRGTHHVADRVQCERVCGRLPLQHARQEVRAHAGVAAAPRGGSGASHVALGHEASCDLVGAGLGLGFRVYPRV
jgi:hypothetical protein